MKASRQNGPDKPEEADMDASPRKNGPRNRLTSRTCIVKTKTGLRPGLYSESHKVPSPRDR